MTDDSAGAVRSVDIYGNHRSVWRDSEPSPFREAIDRLRELPAHDRGEFWTHLRDTLDAQLEYRETTPAPPFAPPACDVASDVKATRRPRIGNLPTHEVVYYLRFGDRVKIGTTTNLERRLRVLPYDELLVAEAGGRRQEVHRHRQFDALRVRNEWFQYAEPLISHIEALRAEAA